MHPLNKVVGLLDAPLRPAFQAVLEQQIAAETLPDFAAAETIKGKLHLFLKAFPPPLSPLAELAHKLIGALPPPLPGR